MKNTEQTSQVSTSKVLTSKVLTSQVRTSQVKTSQRFSSMGKALLTGVSVFALCLPHGLPLVSAAQAQDRFDRDAQRQLALRVSTLAYAVNRGFDRVKYWINSGPKDADKVLYRDFSKRGENRGVLPVTNPLTGPIDYWADGVDWMAISHYTPEPEVKALYCDNVLLVFVDSASPRGIGSENHRLIQRGMRVADEFYNPDKWKHSQRKEPLTGWLEAGYVSGGETYYEELAVPACMDPENLPSGRAARIGYVSDPWLRQTDRAREEFQWRQCPVGQHSNFINLYENKQGQRWKRTGVAHFNALNFQVGDIDWNEWVLDRNHCIDDYTREVQINTPCRFTDWDGVEIDGKDFWTQQKTITAASITYSDPVFKRSSCWDVKRGQRVPELPDPTVNKDETTETSSSSCGSGYIGSISNARTKTVETTTFPWNQDPITNTYYSAWRQTGNSCRQPITCSTREGGGEEGRKWCSCTQGGRIVSSRQGSCGSSSGGGSSGGGGRDGHNGSIDTDGDGITDKPSENRNCGACSSQDVGSRSNDASRGGGSNPTSGNTSSSRVICTHLYEQGLLSRADWVMDLKFTREHLTERHINGYHAWAIGSVHMMRKYPSTRAFWRVLAQARANEIAYLLGKRNKPDYLGKFLRATAEPLCWFIGGFVGQSNWQALYLNSKTGEKNYVA